eukprot:2703659-Prymnesium_polylepis.1
MCIRDRSEAESREFQERRRDRGRTHEPPFKYYDYFESTPGPAPLKVASLGEAYELLSSGRTVPLPRFSVAQLLRFAREFICAFPFWRVAVRCGCGRDKHCPAQAAQEGGG